jgi:hypothetical protein
VVVIYNYLLKFLSFWSSAREFSKGRLLHEKLVPYQTVWVTDLGNRHGRSRDFRGNIQILKHSPTLSLRGANWAKPGMDALSEMVTPHHAC